MLQIKHQFQSVKGDGADATLVQPSDWNALHSTDASPGLIGNPLGVTGPLTEIPLGPGLTFNATQQLEATAKALPIGTVLPLAGNYEPPGWLYCNGKEVSRTTYSQLFDIVQTKFGGGNGTSTFNLPDLRGRVPAGRDDIGGIAPAGRLTPATFPGGATDIGKTAGTERHTLAAAEMPNHTHTLGNAGSHTHHMVDPVERASGTPSLGSTESISVANTASLTYRLDGIATEATVGQTSADGSHTHTINAAGSGNPHLNLQPTMTMTYIIFTGVYL